MGTKTRSASRNICVLFLLITVGAEQIQVQSEWIAETQEQVQIAQQQASLENALVESMPLVYDALGVPPDSGASVSISGKLQTVSGPPPPPPPSAPPPPSKSEANSDTDAVVIVAVVLGVVLVLGLVAWGVLRKPSAHCLPPPLPYKLLPQNPQEPQNPCYEPPRYEPPRYEPPRYDPPRYETPRYDPPRYETPRYDASKYDAPRCDPPPPTRPLPPTPPRYDPEPEECNRQQSQKMVHVVIRR